MRGKCVNRGKNKAGKVKLNAERQFFVVIILLLVIVALIFISRHGFSITPHKINGVAVVTTSLELPYVENNEFLINNSEGRYTIYYDTMYRQARWVAYRLTRDEVERKGAKRKNKFMVDTEIKTRGWAYATDSDYSKSGYDRGHLLPSADRDDTQNENDATFLLSNISPQRPTLNRKTWNNLESEVRRMAVKYDTLYIVTGGDLKPGLKRIGRNGVGVPNHFFKAIMARTPEGFSSIAFFIANSDTISNDFEKYAMSVEKLEKLLNCDFFYNLPDSIERKAEAECNIKKW